LPLLLRISRLIDALSERLGKLCALLCLAACMISAGNAFSRYLFGYSSNAHIEVQWYLFSAIFLLAAGYALKHNEHVRVDIFYGRFSPRTRLWIDLLGGIFFLLPFCAVMIWLGSDFFLLSFHSGETSNDYGGLVRWPVKLLLPLGFAFLLLQGLSEIVKRWAALLGEAKVDTSYEKPVQ
jgi:TRAP-type mannitol/chloroaromatic compound transport system permease small subunit